MGTLTGLVALVTGCGREKGIGRAIALELASAGADIGICDIELHGEKNADEPSHSEDVAWSGLRSLASEIESLGQRVSISIGDVGTKSDADRIMVETVASLGKVDILVNNAAAPHGADRDWMWNVPESAFDDVLRTNTKGVFLMTAAFIRHYVERQGDLGRIVNIASVAGLRGTPQRGAYTASKFAVIGLTESTALEVASKGITVNAICPGAIATARVESSLARAAGGGRGFEGALPPSPPVLRFGIPSDIARAVLFVAEPSAGQITGQAICVDGGTSLAM
jgi:NAD(P)-dependent dehydrogenase (short-subunit alcohol dehydrogenase family)